MPKTKILVVGGAGYVGTLLSNYLSSKEKKITVIDNFWFGDFLNKKIKKIKKDVRNLNIIDFKNQDIVINLAYLSNDPLCEINARDTWEIGPLSTYQQLDLSVKAGVKKYIFASSGSIYGLKKEKNVTEDLGLDPITDYNKSKMICEKVVESFNDKISTTILRPATVCGFSPRLRLDVVLNLFCYQAFFDKQITILGGNQIRPLVHIKDMIRSYEFVINKNIKGCFNIGFENQKVKELAKNISKIFQCKLITKKSNDPRSYRINSDKITSKGFVPKYNSIDAILDLKQAFDKGFKPTNVNWNLKYLTNKKIIV
tara:strand:- start:11477 stop:12415 length:939 start_codon:yes stop_codon:yes gene_type:complete